MTEIVNNLTFATSHKWGSTALRLNRWSVTLALGVTAHQH